MLQSTYLTERDLKNFGFKSLGTNIRISSDARIYGADHISIGNNARIDDFAILASGGGSISIGNYVFIGRSAHLSGSLGIEMHDFSGMAAHTIIYSASDDYDGEYMTAQAIPAKFTTQKGGKVSIGRHVMIGTNCTILGPCNIGEGCSFGAMSSIYKDTDPWGKYIGNPAKRLGKRKQDLLKLEKQFLEELKHSK